MNDLDMIPFVIHQVTMARAERTIKRLTVALVLTAVLAVAGTVIGFLL